MTGLNQRQVVFPDAAKVCHHLVMPFRGHVVELHDHVEGGLLVDVAQISGHFGAGAGQQTDHPRHQRGDGQQSSGCFVSVLT